MITDARELAAVFAGGVVGTIARAGLAEAVVHDPAQWPWATFVVNVLAAALLGYVATRFREHPVSSRRLFWGTGLCGGMSTFATMQLELLDILDAGHLTLAVAYAATSVGVGLLVLRTATNLVRRAERSVA